jgi:hypothetical protein
VTSTLPSDARRCFERFRIAELTTVDPDQQPVTRPVIPHYRQGAPTIDVSPAQGERSEAPTGRADPRVALLFCDPAGSGIDAPIQVLVQGTAPVEAPAAQAGAPPRGARPEIRVRPERVLRWPRGQLSEGPEIHDANLEEVRSGHAEQPTVPHAAGAGGPAAWDARIDELGGRHRSAVLSWVGPDGFPFCVCLPVAADRAQRRIELRATPVGLPLAEGRAGLAFHAHSDDLSAREDLELRGDLVAGERGWAVVPHALAA